MRYVYVIKNLINNKVYVGQTKNPDARKAGHFSIARRGKNTRPFYRAIRKHGENNFSFEVLEECNEEIINEREQHWVAHFDSFNSEKGYNLTNGGSQNFHHSEETKRRIGQATSSRPGAFRGKRNLKLAEFNRSRKGQPGVQLFGAKNPSFGKKGARSPIAKLTQEQVKQILKTKGTGRVVGAKFGVSKTTVERIRNGTSSYVISPLS